MGKLFDFYEKKLAKEGWLKSFLFSLLIGFAALLILEAVIWVANPAYYWLPLIAFVVVVGLGTVALYFLKFRPDTHSIACRIDSLGLEERLLTMTEFANDDSFMARKQREDAQNALSSFDSSLIKFALAVPMIVALAVVGVLSAGMTTMTALAANEKFTAGGDVIDDIIPPAPPAQYEVVYVVNGTGGGYIEGEVFQVVEEGKDATPVMAVAEDGYAFYMWQEDGSEDPYREDAEIMGNKTYTAIFAQLQEGDNGNMSGDNGGEGDQDANKPGDQPGEGENPSPEPGSGMGNTDYSENDKIIDGETDLRSEIGDAYESAKEQLGQEGNTSNGDMGLDYLAGLGGNAKPSEGNNSGSGDNSGDSNNP